MTEFRTILIHAICIFISIGLNAQNDHMLDIQGHRGARGLMPENTIEAFKKALELGVNTLELDVVISSDKQVIVSHEPFMSHEICRSPDGTDILKKDEASHNIYLLSYDEIKTYDCGSKYVERFPNQMKLPSHKPSLQDVVKVSESISKDHYYNIEIKRNPDHDILLHPEYKEFADLVIDKIKALEILERTTVQCFDVETLNYINDRYPEVKLVYLIMNNNSLSENLSKLEFIPEIYSPYYKLVSHELVDACHGLGMRIIPWTVNEAEDMLKQIEFNVDGIITDYPDILIQLYSKHN